MQTQNWLLKQAATQPDRVAVDDGTTQLTFAQLRDRVAQLAGQLDQLAPGDKVGLLTINRLVGYLAALAIICSGRTVVWLNWRLANEELSRQVADSQLHCCLVADELWRPEMGADFIRLQKLAKITAAPAALVPTFNSDRVASIMYTSGTTGKPKGVLQTFGNHFYSAVSSALNLGLTG